MVSIASHTLSPDPALLPQRVRIPLRFRRLKVRSRQELSAHMVRIVLEGDALEGFQSPGFDDHVKLFFPDPQSGEIVIPTVDADGLPTWPEGKRPIARDYTPCSASPVDGSLSIDFVLHDAGPATTWAKHAKVGDALGLGGPRGSMQVPVNFDWHLLVGDDTALPAIARRLRELPAGVRAVVIVEAESSADQLPLQTAAQLEVHWLHREGAPAGSETRFLAALESLSLPERGEVFAWAACESGVARQLRKYLMQAWQLHPKRIKAAGYWKLGAVGVHENIDE